MNRKEFCDLLVKAKKESGIGTKEMCSITSLNGNAVYRIERGVSNFTLELALKYINAINHTITLRHINQKRNASILHYSDFLIFLKKNKKKYTERELAALAEVSDTVIGAIVRKTHIASIETFLKLIEGMGYDVELEMLGNPNYAKQTYINIPNSIFETDCEHDVIINIKQFFKDVIETNGWYKRDPQMYSQKAQYIKNKFNQNKLGIEEISRILDNLGYIPDIKITSPDGGAYFSDYTTAYDILSKIYNINKTLEIDNLESHMVKEGGDKRLRIDVILQYLIKIGCDIDIKWKLPELVAI